VVRSLSKLRRLRQGQAVPEGPLVRTAKTFAGVSLTGSLYYQSEPYLNLLSANTCSSFMPITHDTYLSATLARLWVPRTPVKESCLRGIVRVMIRQAIGQHHPRSGIALPGQPAGAGWGGRRPSHCGKL